MIELIIRFFFCYLRLLFVVVKRKVLASEELAAVIVEDDVELVFFVGDAGDFNVCQALYKQCAAVLYWEHAGQVGEQQQGGTPDGTICFFHHKCDLFYRAKI